MKSMMKYKAVYLYLITLVILTALLYLIIGVPPWAYLWKTYPYILSSALLAIMIMELFYVNDFD